MATSSPEAMSAPASVSLLSNQPRKKPTGVDEAEPSLANLAIYSVSLLNNNGLRNRLGLAPDAHRRYGNIYLHFKVVRKCRVESAEHVAHPSMRLRQVSVVARLETP